MKIQIGYEKNTGEAISIKLSHLVVTGITQESGKTTTLEALIKRSNKRAVIFKTKPGEKSITQGRRIMPFFKEDFDWEYAAELLEASRKEKLKFERSWIIKYAKTANSLVEFKSNIDQALAKDISGEKKIRELEKSVLITLQAYLEKILPELQHSPLSTDLEISDGINIMDLEKFKEETQSLIIKSVLDEILRNYKETIVVIPEAWKYLPQGIGNPVKRPAEKYIRQGAANNNYLWIDSQDITGVEKSILKQVSTWILGYQRELNEIKRTIDQIPLPVKNKPKSDDISSLELGHFYVATNDFTKLVYVQPSWMKPELARKIAKGDVDISTVKKPKIDITPIVFPKIEKIAKDSTTSNSPKIEKIERDLKIEIEELRIDFLQRITELNNFFNELHEKVNTMKTQDVEIDENSIVNKVLQKMPIQNNNLGVNKEEIIKEVLSQIPKIQGSQIYEVLPLEKIKKQFLQEGKDYILSKFKELDEEQKEMIKFLESQNKGINLTNFLEHCLHLSITSGGTRQRVRDKLRYMNQLEIIRLDKNTVAYPHLKETIKKYLELYEANDSEIDQVYNHIMMELV